MAYLPILADGNDMISADINFASCHVRTHASHRLHTHNSFTNLAKQSAATRLLLTSQKCALDDRKDHQSKRHRREQLDVTHSALEMPYPSPISLVFCEAEECFRGLRCADVSTDSPESSASSHTSLCAVRVSPNQRTPMEFQPSIEQGNRAGL